MNSVRNHIANNLTQGIKGLYPDGRSMEIIQRRVGRERFLIIRKKMWSNSWKIKSEIKSELFHIRI